MARATWRWWFATTETVSRARPRMARTAWRWPRFAGDGFATFRRPCTTLFPAAGLAGRTGSR